MSKWIIAVCFAAAASGAASAQMAMPMPKETPAACPAQPSPLPAELAGWQTAPATHASGTPFAVVLGKREDMALDAMDKAKFTLAPAKVKPGTYGGTFTLKADTVGTYRIALSAAAWIDVVKDGKSLPSTLHGHGPDCSGIRKIVDFALTPGSYPVQISNNADARIGVMAFKAAK